MADVLRRRNLHVITNSELVTFRQCRAKHGFAYAEGLRPVVKPAPLSFGTIYHAGAAGGWRAAWREEEASRDQRLEWALEGALDGVLKAAGEHMRELQAAELGPDDSLDQLLGETEEHRDVAVWAVGHYFECAQADLEQVPLAVEAPFTIQVPNKAGQPGTLVDDGVIDLVLWERQTGTVSIHDHKSTKDSVQTLEAKLALDTQLTGYLVAVRQMLAFSRYARQVDRHRQGATTLVDALGTDFWSTMPAGAQAAVLRAPDELLEAQTGALAFNVVRRGRPAKPKLNLLTKKAAVLDSQKALLAAQEQDGEPRGEVSVAQIDTLPQLYEAALDEQRLQRGLAITEKQRERLRALEVRPDPYFLQHEFYRGPEEIERWRREMWVEARQIRAALRDPALRTRNPWACTGPAAPPCAYRAVCLAPDSPEARSGFRLATDVHEEVREAEGHEA